MLISKFKIKIIITLCLLLILTIPLFSCSPKQKSIILATTTSTEDSGLLDFLLPQFQKDTNIKVKVIAKGTGEALEIGKRGDADCLLVHAKEKEIKFIEDKFGIERIEVMYNDFVIVGPTNDPAKIKEKAPKDGVEAFKIISKNNFNFISRGDESGTNTKELALWKEATIKPEGKWYISAGKGMGAVLQMADEKEAYTLTDRATYLSMKERLDLEIVTEKSVNLLNQYGLIRLNPAKSNIKKEESDEFIKWMISDKGQKLIGEYGKEKFGESLFIPNYKR